MFPSLQLTIHSSCAYRRIRFDFLCRSGKKQNRKNMQVRHKHSLFFLPRKEPLNISRSPNPWVMSPFRILLYKLVFRVYVRANFMRAYTSRHIFWNTRVLTPIMRFFLIPYTYRCIESYHQGKRGRTINFIYVCWAYANIFCRRKLNLCGERIEVVDEKEFACNCGVTSATYNRWWMKSNWNNK